MQKKVIRIKVITKLLTFLGVTVQRMLMILLDFSCPSCGFFFRNSLLLLGRQKTEFSHVFV